MIDKKVIATYYEGETLVIEYDNGTVFRIDNNACKDTSDYIDRDYDSEYELDS